MQKYLEAPFFPRKSKTQLFYDLITIVTTRSEVWKTKLLSQTRRTILIRLVIVVIHAYQMTIS